ncbi:cation diffusion facilitator family transporter [Patulibacter sp. NPDC049589]|uniref:cation diffusion facilitator family transporter n=1 Tax=Patulibacter sp. NPDC049589 TaxID=3154731 RepID=UPI0034156C7B
MSAADTHAGHDHVPGDGPDDHAGHDHGAAGDHAGHDHGGGGHGHVHGVSADANVPKLATALALILGFMAVEVVVGLISGSLALLSDAAHMLTDAAAIALSLVAAKLARRPAKGAMTFGLKRVEILSAQANGVTLLILAVIIAIEGVRRLFDPPEVEGGLILVVALAGIVVNLAATWVLAQADRRSLNVEGSFQHVLTDLYAFIGTAVAAGVIMATGFERADPIVSLIIAALMLRSGLGLVRASGRVFLEAAPRGVDPDEIGRSLAAERGVVEIHDLHVWELTSGFPMLSAHVLVGRDADCHGTRRSLEHLIHERFGIEHTTLQVDHEGGDLLKIEPRAG